MSGAVDEKREALCEHRPGIAIPVGPPEGFADRLKLFCIGFHPGHLSEPEQAARDKAVEEGAKPGPLGGIYASVPRTMLWRWRDDFRLAAMTPESNEPLRNTGLVDKAEARLNRSLHQLASMVLDYAFEQRMEQPFGRKDYWNIVFNDGVIEEPEQVLGNYKLVVLHGCIWWDELASDPDAELGLISDVETLLEQAHSRYPEMPARQL